MAGIPTNCGAALVELAIGVAVEVGIVGDLHRVQVPVRVAVPGFVGSHVHDGGRAVAGVGSVRIVPEPGVAVAIGGDAGWNSRSRRRNIELALHVHCNDLELV